MARLAVLVSGSGTILEAMLASGLEVAVVGADRPCRGIDVAERAGLDALVLDRGPYGGFGRDFDRERYSADLAALLRDQRVDLVAMAGFGTVLAAPFHAAFPGRVLNTHPSLLPAFRGWHAVSAALAAGVRETGCTVHVATEALDDGPILAQRRVAVLPGDTVESLHERIKEVERELYPTVVARALSALSVGREPGSVAEVEEDECGHC
ncbi:MAG: phosphoribosylglycinamide formyltransferase [Acidimicrobiales bacterium]